MELMEIKGGEMKIWRYTEFMEDMKSAIVH
jgi:hypothetical protein